MDESLGCVRDPDMLRGVEYILERRVEELGLCDSSLEP